MTEKYKLISNDPIGEDQFESKGQEKTATIIANNIDNEKFKVIGIDGEWGSGKSNLVKILEGKLPKHSFFIYDVWGHQEDEQRKAILTELTDLIIEKKIVRNCDEKKWEEKLETLLANRKKTTTINIPYLSVGFIFSLLSIVYIPSVNVFKDTLVDFFNIDALFWRLILIFAPIFIVIAIYVYYLFSFWIQKKGFKASFKLSAQETFQIYSNKQKTDTKVETISENQPSVREFRNWMNDIDKDIIEKKLIIVFDNFDRLPKKQILSIWSVIHVFFSEPDYKNIKIIVPFDRAHIRNAFKELNSKELNSLTSNNENNNQEDHNSIEVNYANDYINKTFDIVFRVAPPILSSWKSFFEKKWQEAFSENYNREEYLKSLQAYEVLRPIITPREIIAFINEVVALKLIDETIPNRYISIFVLKKEEIISDPLRAVINLEYLEGIKYAYINDPNYQKYITALAYQIDSEKALEIVYRRNLKNSLINGDKEMLNEISKTNVFSSILQSVILDIENYEKPVEALNSLSDEALISEYELNDIWDDIYFRQKNDDIPSGKLEKIHVILLKKINDRYKPKWLEIVVSNLYCEESNFFVLDFISRVDKLNAICVENNIDLDVYSYLSNCTVNIKDYISVVDEKKDKYTKYKLVCPKSTVITYLNELTSEKLQFHEFVFYLDYEFELVNFCERVKSFITENSGDSEYVKYALSYLKNISNDSIDNILSENNLYSLVNQTEIDDPFFIDLACMRLVLGSSSDSRYSSAYETMLKTDDKSFHERVAQEIEHYINLDELLIKSIDFQNNLIKGIIPKLFELESEKRALDVNKVLENITTIIEVNEIDPETILLELDKYDFVESLNYEFIDKLGVEFFNIAKESESSIANYIIKVFEDHFKEADSAIWDKTFNNLESKDLSILLTLNFAELNSFALESFNKKLIDISRNQDDKNLDIIYSVIVCFEKSKINLENTFKNLRDNYILYNNITKNQFIAFLQFLFLYGELNEKPADAIRTIFKSSFLDDPNCVRVMIEFDLYITDVINECLDSEKSDFIDAIKDRSNDDQIFNLAEKLNINIEKPRKAEK